MFRHYKTAENVGIAQQAFRNQSLCTGAAPGKFQSPNARSRSCAAGSTLLPPTDLHFSSLLPGPENTGHCVLWSGLVVDKALSQRTYWELQILRQTLK